MYYRDAIKISPAPEVREVIYFPKATELITLNDTIVDKYLLDYVISDPANFNVEAYQIMVPP